MTPDQLQNEVLTIGHHLDDIEQSIKSGDNKYALEGIKDARESLNRLLKFLPSNIRGEMARMSESSIINNIGRVLTEDPNVFNL